MAPRGAIVTSAPQLMRRIGTRRKPRPRQRIDADLHQRQHMSTGTSARKPRGGAINVGIGILTIKLRQDINRLRWCSRIQVEV